MLRTYFNRVPHRRLAALCAAAIVGFAGGLLFTGERCQLDTNRKNTLSEKLNACVLCVVTTQPENHRHQEARGWRCSQLLLSSQTDTVLPVAALNVSDGREELCNKAKAAQQGKQLLGRDEWLLNKHQHTFVAPRGYMGGRTDYNLSSHVSLGGLQKQMGYWELDSEHTFYENSVSQGISIGGEAVRSANGGDSGASHSAGSVRNPDFRFQASLWWDRNESPLCGAAVINERNLLTAAHCLYDGVMRPTRRPTNFLRITVGSADYQQAASYEVGYTYTHPKFDTLGLDNDIAVVRLKKPMEQCAGVRSIALATRPPAPGSICQLSGWGAWANRGNTNTTTLRHMDVIVLTQDKCLGLRDSDVTTPLICVAPVNGDAYTQADDGGPLTCSDQLVGVIIRNGWKGLGVAITDVSLHADFVAESLVHPGRSAWPFVSSLLAGCSVAGSCLAVTALLARLSGAR